LIAHPPVLVEEVLKSLTLRPGATVLDATIGLGGHAEAILRAIGEEGTLIGMDRDREALKHAENRLKDFGQKMKLIHGHFGELKKILGQLHADLLDAALFDLGISALQLEGAGRGFSFAREGPLDMRMDQTESLTASKVVNEYPWGDLEEVIRKYGQERWARRIARAIVKVRPFKTTTELAAVVRRAIPARSRGYRIDPATRTFQAIRIEINRELELLPQGLSSAVELLKVGGRIAVLSYHSLEDRIVKNLFRGEAREGRLTIVTRKPIRPSPKETALNPRSRSARLRIAERKG
jgi:16S rRNA (cytosine1402-N4)-methyltransferase